MGDRRRAHELDGYRITEAIMRGGAQLEGRTKGQVRRDKGMRGEVPGLLRRDLDAAAKADKHSGRSALSWNTTPFPPHVIPLLSLHTSTSLDNRHHVTKPCPFG